MADLATLLDSLFAASFRGVPFHIFDSRRETGRRWQQYLFPGSDGATWEDLGRFDGPIRVQGLVIGDDYVASAMALEDAFGQAGPGTLVHPWYGVLQVVLAEPAELSFAQDELRVARITASFAPWNPSLAVATDPLSQVLGQARALRNQATAWLGSVLAPVRLSVALVASAASFGAQLRVLVNTAALATHGGSALLASLGAPFANLGSIGSLPADVAYAGAVAAGRSAALASAGSAASAELGFAAAVALRFEAPIAAIAVASITPAQAAIGGVSQASQSITERSASTLLLGLAASLAAAAPPASTLAPVAAMALATRCYALARAAETVAAIPFESQTEATAWHARLDAGLAAAADSAAALAATDPAGAGPLWQQLGALRAAAARDLQAALGRLPAVARLTLPGPASLWQVANHLAGDDPASILAEYRDLAARNRLRNPGRLSAGTVLERLA